MLAQQRRQPVTAVLFDVLLAAGTEVALVDQVLSQGQHPTAADAAASKVGE